MTSALDIYRTANVLIREHGEDAALEAAQRADVTALELAQAVSAAELTRDIEALRLQNVTMELNAIYDREDANRSLPTDAVRKEQLLTQMAEIIKALEK